MTRYGQYCPMARTLEILGDRWTLLIIRDLLSGATHFNELERGLPGISRGLLAQRLRRLQESGILEKQVDPRNHATAYCLTQAGRELHGVVDVLVTWGAAWAFGDPTEDELDPLLLMWWMRARVNTDQLPVPRVVLQFDFPGVKPPTYWLVLRRDDVTLCLTHPGYEVDVLVSARLDVLFKLWLGRLTYLEALGDGMDLQGPLRLVRAFPQWFAWSLAAPAVRAARSVHEARQAGV